MHIKLLKFCIYWIDVPDNKVVTITAYCKNDIIFSAFQLKMKFHLFVSKYDGYSKKFCSSQKLDAL